MTTVVPGLHPLVSAALETHNYTLTSVQFQTLSRVINHQHSSGVASSEVLSSSSSTAGGANGTTSVINNNNSEVTTTTTATTAASSSSTSSSAIPPDCIVETPRNSGHCLCMVIYAAHFVHSAANIFSSSPDQNVTTNTKDPNQQQQPAATNVVAPFSVIVARDSNQVAHIIDVAHELSIPALRFVDASTLDSSAGSRLPLARTVIVGTTNTLEGLNWQTAASHATCITLLVEEACPDNAPTSCRRDKRAAGNMPPSALGEALIAKITGFISNMSSLWPKINLCLLSSKPPSYVHPSLRYILRRNNRAYLPARSAVPVFSTLLCWNASDRNDLCHSLAQSQNFHKVLILTHNREVKELRAELHQTLGLRTFAIQRATATVERERILTAFLECDDAILVAMDAFTGIDLMDVDGVIQYYPPQKSMSDEEWTEFVSFLRSTGDSSNTNNNGAASAVVITLAAIDELNLIKHIQTKCGFTGPVLNISPGHPNFEDFVMQPNLAVLAKLASREEQEANYGIDTASGTTPPFALFKQRYEVSKATRLSATALAQPKSSQRGGPMRDDSNVTSSTNPSVPAPKSKVSPICADEVKSDDGIGGGSRHRQNNNSGNNKNHSSNNNNNNKRGGNNNNNKKSSASENTNTKSKNDDDKNEKNDQNNNKNNNNTNKRGRGRRGGGGGDGKN